MSLCVVCNTDWEALEARIDELERRLAALSEQDNNVQAYREMARADAAEERLRSAEDIIRRVKNSKTEQRATVLTDARAWLAFEGDDG